MEKKRTSRRHHIIIIEYRHSSFWFETMNNGKEKRRQKKKWWKNIFYSSKDQSIYYFTIYKWFTTYSRSLYTTFIHSFLVRSLVSLSVASIIKIINCFPILKPFQIRMREREREKKKFSFWNRIKSPNHSKYERAEIRNET